MLRHQLDSADPLAADETDAKITVDTEEEIDILDLTSKLRRMAETAKVWSRSR